MITRPVADRNWPLVSVIIPVFNDADRLKICLAALEKQSYPPERYEVIAVDNGSSESIESLVAAFPHACCSVEHQPGSYAARNHGVSLAKGEVFAFVDSDCVPAGTWLEKGVQRLLYSPNTGLVGGKVEFLFRDPAHPSAIELFDSITAFQQKEYIEVARFSGAGNLFTFRSVFEQVGSFNGGLKSGGDFEWSRRVDTKGYQLVYADDACVGHPARNQFGQIRQKYLRVVAGEHEIKTKNGYPLQDFFRDLVQNVLLPLKSMPRLMFRGDMRLSDKVRVAAIMFSVRLLQAVERVRLRLGAQSSLR